jgi:hypothetical protein
MWRGYVSGAIKANDPDQAALGVVRAASQQQIFATAKLRDFGIAPSMNIVEGIAKRRLWRYARNLIGSKGTGSGLVIMAACAAGWLVFGASYSVASLRFLTTWDGRSPVKIVDFTSYPGLSYTPGVVHGFTDLVVNAWTGGLFVDFWGRRKSIASNTATTITLVDSSFVGSDVYAFTATIGSGNNQLTGLSPVVDVLDGSTLNDYAFVTHDGSPVIIHKESGTVCSVVSSMSTGLAQYTMTVATGGAALSAGTGTFYIARGFSAGYTQPWSRVTLHTDSSLLYNNRFSLNDSDADNQLGLWHDYLWEGMNGGPGSLPFGDLVLVVPSGAARYVYHTGVSSVAATRVVTVTGGAVYPNVRVGDWINPNRDQPIWFLVEAIKDNGGSVDYTVRPQNGIVPFDVMNGIQPNVLTIVPRATMERDQLVRSMAKMIFSSDCRLFLYYTP